MERRDRLRGIGAALERGFHSRPVLSQQLCQAVLRKAQIDPHPLLVACAAIRSALRDPPLALVHCTHGRHAADQVSFCDVLESTRVGNSKK
jgi:hypothetical protein